MLCEKCGKTNSDNSNFCLYCGAKLSKSELLNDTISEEAKREAEYNETRGNKLGIYFGRNKHFVDFYSNGKALIIFLTLLLIGIVAGFLAFLFFSNNPKFSLNRIAFIIGFIIIFLAILAIFIISLKSVISTMLAKKALTKGIDSRGIIVDKHKNVSTNNYSYYLTFRYEINGEKHQTTQRVSNKLYSNYKIYDVIEIKTYNKSGVIVE